MQIEKKECFVDGIKIEGLYEIYPKIRKDSRGYFMESYNEADFSQAGIAVKFVQDNISKSVKGVLRGLHFQTHHPQAKLVGVIVGKVFDVVVDLRKGSKTFGKNYSYILDGEEKNMLFVPEGFAHGFYVLSDEAIFTYKCSDFYDPQGEGGLMWNDKQIGIDWNSVIGDFNPILAEKDKNHHAFDFSKDYFDINGKWLGK
ncbi:MAG: dTDP-4-dehydrorhamnose 3,5-epimerase [Treponema sp.]|nr:dTDP-4-dehydrorhamnose 3,5-epimerase [Treponema sp.]